VISLLRKARDNETGVTPSSRSSVVEQTPFVVIAGSKGAQKRGGKCRTASTVSIHLFGILGLRNQYFFGCFVFCISSADMPRFSQTKRLKTPLFEPDSLLLILEHHGELRRFPFRVFLPISGIPAGRLSLHTFFPLPERKYDKFMVKKVILFP